MGTITDFQGWLDQLQPEDYEEVYSLYRTVSDESNFGSFSLSQNGSKLFVKEDCTADTLMLASPKAKTAFLNLLEAKYCPSDMEMEGWYNFQRSMSKDD